MQGPAHAVQLWLHIYLRSNIATLQPFQSNWAPSAVMPLRYQFTVHKILSILFSCQKWLACLTYTIVRTVLTTYNCAYTSQYILILLHAHTNTVCIQQYSSLIHELACVYCLHACCILVLHSSTRSSIYSFCSMQKSAMCMIFVCMHTQ